MKLHHLTRRKLEEYEAKMGKSFREVLRTWYDKDKCSFAEISLLLRETYDISMSEWTVRQWYWKLVGRPRSRSAAAAARHAGESWL